MPERSAGVRDEGNLIDGRRLGAALEAATAALLAEFDAAGCWCGDLSCSALSTATAVIALQQIAARDDAARIARGLEWLAAHQNDDGGWGDTVRSKSNLSTTALVWAAFGSTQSDARYPDHVERTRHWIARAANLSFSADFAAPLVRAIEGRYGKDRTFSIPIVMTLALSGRLGADGWRFVRPLPFELAALPHQFFGALRLPVVSYAMPALIAIGQVIAEHAPARNPLTRFLRGATRTRTANLLERIQPSNGGFLEATPLTSFVTMSMAASRRGDGLVARRGAEFLRQSMRADGSWPIDTNLATWLTTLAVKALARDWPSTFNHARASIRRWLLAQQFQVEHPYTHAAPGGWAWTNLPGGVPDADDTAGALLALLELGTVDEETRRAGVAGVEWLVHLQNNDGGIPTFCRGWGALPFDRSSADLSAHALRAWSAWMPHLPEKLKRESARAIRNAVRFLSAAQRADGSWAPLWFGNEGAPDDLNLTYGTAKVVLALEALRSSGIHFPRETLECGCDWLVRAQQLDGGWSGFPGGTVSIEESALATEALVELRPAASAAGIRWLIAQVESGAWREPAPIGFYFAKLWYFERLYPLIFTVGALARARRCVE